MKKETIIPAGFGIMISWNKLHFVVTRSHNSCFYKYKVADEISYRFVLKELPKQ